MRLARTFFTLVVAASLAVLPTRVGAIGIFGGSGTAAPSMSDCASMGDGSCQSAPSMSADAGEMVPMSDGCDRSRGHGTLLPGACSTYCNSLPALPTIAAIPAGVVLIAAVVPAIGPIMDGIGVSPEPHPPKLV
jgi:hypothetical protein